MLEANFQLTCNWSLGFSSREPKVNNCIWRKKSFNQAVEAFCVEALSRKFPCNCISCLGLPERMMKNELCSDYFSAKLMSSITLVITHTQSLLILIDLMLPATKTASFCVTVSFLNLHLSSLKGPCTAGAVVLSAFLSGFFLFHVWLLRLQISFY